MLLHSVPNSDTHPINPKKVLNQSEINDIYGNYLQYVPQEPGIQMGVEDYAEISGKTKKRKQKSSPNSDLKNKSSNCEQQFLCKNLRTCHNFPLFILFFHWQLHDIQAISLITEENRVSKFLKLAFNLAMVLKIVMTIKLLPQMDKLFSYRNYW